LTFLVPFFLPALSVFSGGIACFASVLRQKEQEKDKRTNKADDLWYDCTIADNQKMELNNKDIKK